MNTLKRTIAAAAAIFTLAYASAEELPRAEYPRPQFERQEWINLNGTWDFEFDFGKSGMDRELFKAGSLSQEITVPFCPESELSGIGHTDFINCVWYRRDISIPEEWNGKNIYLNFGAVDYAAEIFIDGILAGRHYGGSSSFSIDLSGHVEAEKIHNLVIRVEDNQRSGEQSVGKQCSTFNSAGCFYTRTTGIWQTVWMEAVDRHGLKRLTMRPDIDQCQLMVMPEFYSESDCTLEVSVKDNGKTVARKSVPCSNHACIVLPLKKMKLWSPEDPFLYDVDFHVKDAGGNVLDHVKSYAGMRKIHISDGKVYLNNREYFQRLVLDQGFYPDGIWTAPSDEALRHDIELAKAAGFNGARLHQKVFEERYFYWADRLGYLTWGEGPSYGMNVNNEIAARNFLSEWLEIVVRDRNHPSLVTWTPFNETWDSQDGTYPRFVRDIYAETKAADPTRPINDASGDDHVMTDIWSVHNYEQDGDKLKEQLALTEGREPYRHSYEKEFLAVYGGQPYILDEFGGIGWMSPEERKHSWGYGNLPQTEEEFYSRLDKMVKAVASLEHIAGFCYTQLTDVEQEKNGIYKYDRTEKLDIEKVRHIFMQIPSFR